MATIKEGWRGPGSVWARALALWVDFATGTYTSWSYQVSILNAGFSVEITVGLPAGGTDVYKLEMIDTNWNNLLNMRMVFGSPGWRTMPQIVLPTTVPGGQQVDLAFSIGPWALRDSILSGLCNASGNADNNHQYSAPEGAQTTVFVKNWKSTNIIFVDVISIMWGALTGLDTIDGQPTDLIGDGPTLLVSSGGGVDLSGVESALLDIATADVDYTFNQEGVIYTMRGMVRAGP